MAETALIAEPRSVEGSSACRKLRRQGYTPAVVYGHKEGSVNLQVKDDDIARMVREGHKLVDLDIKGEHEKAIIRDVQWDTWSKHVLHVDFMRVSKGEMIEIELPLEFVGEPIGLANGGVMEHPNVSLKATCPALQIPDAIKVDISAMKIGDSKTVADLQNIPPQVNVLDDPDTAVATIIDPAAIEAAVAAADEASEAAPSEPEQIGAEETGDDDTADTAVVN